MVHDGRLRSVLRNGPVSHMLQVFLMLLCRNTILVKAQVVTAIPPRPQDYPTRVPGTCGNTNSFDCSNGKCVPFTSVRNCVDDCGNGADETCGQGLALCDTALVTGGCGKCITNGTQEKTCVDSLYISLCSRTGSVKCRATPNCVISSWVGDGKNDCGDNSDEDPCYMNSSRCSPNANCNYDLTNQRLTCSCKTGYAGDGFTCTVSTGGGGGTNGTGNQTDILGRIPGSCSSTPLQFDCGNGLCLPIAKFRDCRNDCPDGVDETCWVGQIRCDGCKCVDPQDQATQCVSARNCAANGQFACVGGGCIFDAMVLDGTADCADGSDENYCSRYLTCPAGGRCVYDPTTHNFTCNCPTPLVANAKGVCSTNGSTSSKDCADVMTTTRTTTSGVQTVTISNCTSGTCTKQVYCDLETEGGGWTVIQRRQDGSVDFFRNWTDYKNGFGSLTGEFWLGNEYVAQVTNRGVVYELYILMTTTQNQVVRARYDLFRLGPESDSYRLKLGNFIAGDNDNLQNSRDARFGTIDQDTDLLSNVICGVWWRSGWWFEPNCGSTGNLNVPYNPVPQYGNLAGILWPGTARNARMRATLMMIRPLGFSSGAVTSPRSQNQQLGGCPVRSSIIVIVLAALVALSKRR